MADEFEAVDIDLGEHELSVTTDRIVLEGINLGSFKIRLDWHLLGFSSAYRVMALDPNPAAKNEDITHPHVQDGNLCEGEGRSAVQAALEECRLYDFFLLVSRLLHTYGRGKPSRTNWTASRAGRPAMTIAPAAVPRARQTTVPPAPPAAPTTVTATAPTATRPARSN